MGKDTQWTKSVFATARRSKETRLHKFFSHGLVQFLIFVFFVSAIVAIIVSGLEGRQRLLNESLVGQVAPFTVEATRDFSFSETDQKASARLRQEVSASVPPVYDWQEGLAETVREQISTAFSSIRDAMAESIREELQALQPERLEHMTQRATPTLPLTDLLIQSVSRERRIQLAHEFRQEHFRTPLRNSISDADFEVFARIGFRPDIEHNLAALVDAAMSELIVANVRRLERDRDTGIYLRRMRFDQVLVEYHVTDIPERFFGVEHIPRLMEEGARQKLLSVQDAQLRQALISSATVLARPNTTFNESKTLEKRKAARDAVVDQILSEDFRKGQIIVDKGHIVTERHFRIIQQMLHEDDSFQHSQVLAGTVVIALLLLVTLFLFGRKNIRFFRPRPKDVFFMGTVLLLFLLIARMGTITSLAVSEQLELIPVEAWYFLIPIAAGGMLVRLVLNSEQAIVFAILIAVFAGIIVEHSLFFAVYTTVGTLVGISTVRHVKHRMALMWSGMIVGFVNMSLVLAFLLIQGTALQFETVFFLLMSFLSGLASGFLISAVLPVFEAGFGYTTDIKLLELANLNHPALRELILRAPGSYHHSMIVGSLSEAASETIGCNALLARVGATYHDIGKAKNPQYFAENQKAGENPHDKLKPNMSALIIKSHVKDGLDMARQYRLPLEIHDFIAQHHGTSLIAYFYHKAKELEDPNIPEVDEKDYRYPGPKPQTRETAICMLADGIEAASRALPNPSPARLKGLVQTMINKAFTDGQLDECDLTLKDLNSIAKAFTRILTGIYHQRPEYPGAAKKDSGENKDDSRRSGPKTGAKASKKKETVSTDTNSEQSDQSAAATSALSPQKIATQRNRTSTDKQDGAHEHRHQHSRKRNEASENQSRTRNDSGMHIPTLPRLGTSKS